MKVGTRVKSSLILQTMLRTSKLLTPSENLRAVRIGIYTLFIALIDVAGLALAFPVLMAANDRCLVSEPGMLHDFKEFLGIQSYETYMIYLAALLLLVFVIKNGISLFASYLQSKFAYDVATNLARRQFVKYYNRGYSYFKQTNSAEISNNVLNMPVFFVGGVLVSLINFLTELTVLLLVVMGIALANFTLFVALVFVLMPFGFLIYGMTKNRLSAIGEQQLKLGAITLQRVNQAIFGYVDVRLTNKENYFMNEYIREQITMNESYKMRHVINMIPSRALEAVGILGILVIFIYTFYTNENNDSVFKFVTLFAAASSRVLPSLNRCLAAVMGIKSQLFALDVLEEGSMPTVLEKMDVHPLSFEKTIELKNLSFQFEGSDLVAVNDLTILVKKGEKIGIMGESGSGKTTLMNILLRFLVEKVGGIYIDGVKLGPNDIASWRAKIGYVQQNVFLLDANMRQNVAFGEHEEEIDDERLRIAIEQAHLTEFVESLPFGLETQVGEMGARLSGGQRQRIGIARALYFQSSVLVFDEATSALDTDTENAITESIQALQNDMTVFVVAHRITTLRNCDRILELKDGKLIHIWNYPDLIHAKMLK